MKKFIIGISLVATTILLYSTCSTNTYAGRFIKWRSSDIMDYEKFPKYDFHASQTPFYFHKNFNTQLDNTLFSVSKEKKSALAEILESSGSTAFLIIKNDTLVYENYFNEYDRNSINTSFSVAKSITSLVVGKAIDDKIITSIDDQVIKYIPDLAEIDNDYNQLKISHLLDMKSGIQFKDHDLPWGDKPKAYYYPRLRERIKSLPLEYEPGSKFKYNSYNPILLGMILEQASGTSPAALFEKGIWDQIGMEFDGSWSMDSEESRMTKMESGVNLRAIDFAKLGRLVLNNGEWNGKQVISTDWMEYSFSLDEKHHVPEFGEEIFYKNLWWLYGKKIDDQYATTIISGWGHLGQYLYIFPEEKIIIVRMGMKNKNVDSWGRIFKEIAAFIN